jgi:hypothetical protein
MQLESIRQHVTNHRAVSLVAIGALVVGAVAITLGTGAVQARDPSIPVVDSVGLPPRFAGSTRAEWAVQDLSSTEVQEFEHWPRHSQDNYLTVASVFAWNPASKPPTPSASHALQAIFLKTLRGVENPNAGYLSPKQLAQLQQQSQAGQESLTRQYDQEIGALAEAGSGYGNWNWTASDWTSTSAAVSNVSVAYSFLLPGVHQLSPVAFFVCVAPGASATRVHLIGGVVQEYVSPSGQITDSQIALQPWTDAAVPITPATPSLFGYDQSKRKTFPAPSGLQLTTIDNVLPGGVVVSTTTGAKLYFSLSTDTYTSQIPTASQQAQGPQLCEPVRG